MIQTELFTIDPGPLPTRSPETIPEAITAGHSSADAENPFLWSSDMWEAFNLGKYLNRRGISPEGFRKSRGSSFVNKAGLRVKYYYQGASWCLTSNR